MADIASRLEDFIATRQLGGSKEHWDLTRESLVALRAQDALLTEIMWALETTGSIDLVWDCVNWDNLDVNEGDIQTWWTQKRSG